MPEAEAGREVRMISVTGSGTATDLSNALERASVKPTVDSDDLIEVPGTCTATARSQKAPRARQEVARIDDFVVKITKKASSTPAPNGTLLVTDRREG